MSKQSSSRFYWFESDTPKDEVMAAVYESVEFDTLLYRFLNNYDMSPQEFAYEVQSLAEAKEERIKELRQIAAFEERMLGSEE